MIYHQLENNLAVKVMHLLQKRRKSWQRRPAFLVNTLYSDTMNALVNGSHVTAITFETESDGLTFLIVAGVLFLLSYVFRYAQELQKLSDETL